MTGKLYLQMVKHSWGNPDKRLIKKGIVMCPRCGKRKAIIHNIYGVLPCKVCKENTGSFTPALKSGWATRNTKRVWDQQSKYETDFIQPHVYDKFKKKLVINPAFVKQYPDKVRHTFTKDEMIRGGYKRLADYSSRLDRTEKGNKKRLQGMVQYSGDASRKLKDILRS